MVIEVMVSNTDITSTLSPESQAQLAQQQALSKLIMDGILSLVENQCDCAGCAVWRQIAKLLRTHNK